ncbi:MAG: RelA/SpoT family protein [Treponema lecithinolyticum]|uniref:RelA/SpoT family protein n=1 Tax=Treponema lecithinolyticum TaxID=53418 RepID=UPI0036243ED7
MQKPVTAENAACCELLKSFFQTYPRYADEVNGKKTITEAWDFLCSCAQTADKICTVPPAFSAVDHSFRVACILAENNLDTDCIVAGILHNIFDLKTAQNKTDTVQNAAKSFSGLSSGTAQTDTYASCEREIEKRFGSAVLNIVQSIRRITGLNMKSKTLDQADAFRKMLFAMTDDIRVILVKMAERLDSIRSASSLKTDRQKQLAAEIIEIWAPLANRLGMSAVKIEMEDLSLKCSNPDVFAQLKQIVALKKNERAEYIEKAQKEIYKAASKAGLEVTVYGRAKHFYSIYQKMKRKNRTAEELLDLLALRILCKTSADCYVMVGLVHNLWKPLEGRFKDYIAMPKENGYQSIHTTVLCGTRPLEVQIRTHEMHSVAELGVASHWLYKKGMNKDSVDIGSLSIINQLRELRRDHLNDEAFFNEIKNELLGDSIFVFTPQGEVKKLAAGATALDFAYAVHTHIGQTITGAKADGHIIPLSRALKNTQIVEILTHPQAHPTENQLAMAKTARARSKIRAYLAQHAQEGTQGSVPVQTQNQGQGQTLAAVSAQTSAQTSSAYYTGAHGETEGEQNTPIKIRIGDTSNFLVTRAKCCNPRYGDSIVGYVSRGRGITVHRADCKNFNRIANVNERKIPVLWEEQKNGTPKPAR